MLTALEDGVLNVDNNDSVLRQTTSPCATFRYLRKFDLAPVFSKEEFMHWFLPQDKIIDSYVVENNGKITGQFPSYTYCTYSLIDLLLNLLFPVWY